MIEVWKENSLESGDYVSDGRLLFRRQDVECKSLLKKLEKLSETRTTRAQKFADGTFSTLRKSATQILDFDKHTRYMSDKSGGMIFKDCFGDEWKIQRKYYQLAKRLLKFDYLLGLHECVMFVKNSEIIGALMCFA